ncbi:MAG: hypothetical protein ACXVCV_15925 [Polyangia bacterium]
MTRLGFALSLATLMNVFAPDAHAQQVVIVLAPAPARHCTGHRSRPHRRRNHSNRMGVGSARRDMAPGWSFAVWTRAAPARTCGVVYYYGSPYLPSL